MPSVSREQITDATLKLFRERGMANVTTREVADTMQLSRSHLYYYFPNWQSLRLAAFEQFANHELADAQLQLQQLDAVTALHEFLKACIPTQKENTWQLWLGAWHESLHDSVLAKAYLASMKQWEKLLQSLIERGQAEGVFHCENPAVAARQLFAMINGYATDIILQSKRSAGKAAKTEMQQAAKLILSMR